MLTIWWVHDWLVSFRLLCQPSILQLIFRCHGWPPAMGSGRWCWQGRHFGSLRQGVVLTRSSPARKWYDIIEPNFISGSWALSLILKDADYADYYIYAVSLPASPEKSCFGIPWQAQSRSQEESSRLSTGALIRQEELIGERLKYSRLSGTGPSTGWVSLKVKDKPRPGSILWMVGGMGVFNLAHPGPGRKGCSFCRLPSRPSQVINCGVVTTDFTPVTTDK